MKKVLKVLLSAAAAAVLFSAGCNNGCVNGDKKYTFYTNIPAGGYTVIDDDFRAGELIGGYSGAAGGGEFTAPDGYTAKSQDYYRMFADALVIVAADFNAEGAEDKFKEFADKIDDTLAGIEAAVSSTLSGTDIDKFNTAAAGEKIQISYITYEVLEIAKSVYELTGNYYNPALYYNIQAYGFGGAADYPENNAGLPADGLIEKYTDLASHFGDIELCEEEGRYYVVKPAYTVEVEGEILSMKLDLGGIGKGYAVDRVDELFDEYGYEYGLFNFGGSSMLIKQNVLVGDYSVQPINPRSPFRDEYLKVPARNVKLSSSGDYEQFYIIDDVRYCHIVDPTTGKPVNKGIMSVTIIGGGAAEDDALTTAIMCMGRDEAIKFIEEKLSDRRVVFTVSDVA